MNILTNFVAYGPNKKAILYGNECEYPLFGAFGNIGMG